MSAFTSRPRPKGLLPIAGGTMLAAAGMVGLLGISRAISWLALAAGLALIAGGAAWRGASRKGPPLAAAYPAPGGWPAPAPARRHPADWPTAGRWPAPPAAGTAGAPGPGAFAAALDAWQRASPVTRGTAPVRADDDHHPI
jgi:hypothetical protein